MSDTNYPNAEERNWALAAHLLGAAGVLFSAATLSWLGPLVVYVMKRDQSRFVAFHALQSLFFQLAWMVILAVGWGITVMLMFVVVGFLLIIPMVIVSFAPLIWPIIAAVKASNGEWYEYPLAGEWARNVLKMPAVGSSNLQPQLRDDPFDIAQ